MACKDNPFPDNFTKSASSLNPKDLALAMSIEVGELLEHFRYKDPEKIAEKLRTDQEYKREVGYELADVFYHVLVIADHLGIDLSTTFKEKLAVTAKKYPVHLVKGRNEKHTFYKK